MPYKDAQGEADLATKRDIDDLQRDMREIEATLRRDMKELEQRIIIKLGALTAFPIGIVATLIKLL